MVLEEVFDSQSIVLELKSTEKDELFEEMADVLHSVHPEFDAAEAVSALNAREEKMSTGIMHGIAVPHGVVPSLKKIIGAIGISRDGINYGSLDKTPVHIVFMILSGENMSDSHIQLLKSLAAVLQTPGFTEKLLAAKTKADAFNILLETSFSKK